jgi:hypothetical protein
MATKHRPFDNPHDAENTARMGDKAKPSSVGAPTALLFEGAAHQLVLALLAQSTNYCCPTTSNISTSTPSKMIRQTNITVTTVCV